MTKTYMLKSHQKHKHIRFVYEHGYHEHDFALHKHDFSELFIVFEGSGKHQVSEWVYPLSKGDVFVINGEVEHGFKDVDNLRIVNLMFDSKVPLFESSHIKLLPGYQALFNVEPLARKNNEYQAKLTLDLVQLARIEELLQQINFEYNNAPNGFEPMLSSLMQQLVITLSRTYQGASQESNQQTLALSRALVYIEQYFSKTSLNSEQIAQAAYMSKRQIERLFRQFLHTSPNQYIREVQLNHGAKILKEDASLSIQAVSEMCGFSDSNYFSKCFKNQHGVSPRQYR
ncbi:helix-turn-helix domain-containing protein [Vibrio sp. ZSDE26]|uniref:Helix-turn-helix domain-containing protein n=1 Tax=Vibrio amylolyticus TaxID=2847292 RepID=A0A9X2BJE5_9VIBR|nr:helix-turn-helix domain-containing protein [Vibrio amylolyticus]MCK6263392.1 helix-turn-helix domain-containing protein [Vibrio amylolyticus]